MSLLLLYETSVATTGSGAGPRVINWGEVELNRKALMHTRDAIAKAMAHEQDIDEENILILVSAIL